MEAIFIEIKDNIKSYIKEYIERARKNSLELKKNPNNPRREILEKYMALNLATARCHRTALMIGESLEKHVDPKPFITKRKELMGEILEIVQTLVVEGEITEMDYLKQCEKFKLDAEIHQLAFIDDEDDEDDEE